MFILCCFWDIIQNCCFMCCQQWNIIHKSSLFWNTMRDIHLLISLQQKWKESEWFHHQATWRIKEIINLFILFFTTISQSYLRGQQSFTLSLNFFASFMWTVVFCLFPDEAKGKIFHFVFSFIVQRLFTECDAISFCWNIAFMVVECTSFSLFTANGHRDGATRG